jgi:hypothetical protein
VECGEERKAPAPSDPDVFSLAYFCGDVFDVVDVVVVIVVVIVGKPAILCLSA